MSEAIQWGQPSSVVIVTQDLARINRILDMGRKDELVDLGEAMGGPVWALMRSQVNSANDGHEGTFILMEILPSNVAAWKTRNG